MSIVYTGGTFDIFHLGHANLLTHCRKIAGEGGRVIVGLNTDAFIREFKGKDPVNNYASRERVLRDSRNVDLVIANKTGSDSKPTILKAVTYYEKFYQRFVVIGTDWAVKDYYKQMDFTQQWLDENWITLCYVPYTEGLSSSQLRLALLD